MTDIKNDEAERLAAVQTRQSPVKKDTTTTAIIASS